jgi:hypothetical protein
VDNFLFPAARFFLIEAQDFTMLLTESDRLQIAINKTPPSLKSLLKATDIPKSSWNAAGYFRSLKPLKIRFNRRVENDNVKISL